MTATALDRLPDEARVYLDDYLVGAHNPDNLTAAVVVDTLPAKAALLERFDGAHNLNVVVVPELGAAWVARWDWLTLLVPSRGDVELARSVVTTRAYLRSALRVSVMAQVDALGLPNRRMFLKPPQARP